jgi:RimJ/RimL family protein N-acetyltransferase
MFGRKVKKTIAIIRDHCVSMSFQDMVVFIWRSLFRSEKIFVYCISLQTGGLTSKKNRFPISKGDISDLECERKRFKQLPWEFQCDRYDGVKDFFIFRENGIIGHISWVYYKHNPNRLLYLEKEECEIKFCLTLPDFRGKGLYPAALETIQEYLKQNGFHRCFICVRDDNLSSIQGIEKSGFRRVGEIHFRKIFGFQTSSKCDTRRLIIMPEV